MEVPQAERRCDEMQIEGLDIVESDQIIWKETKRAGPMTAFSSSGNIQEKGCRQFCWVIHERQCCWGLSLGTHGIRLEWQHLRAMENERTQILHLVLRIPRHGHNPGAEASVETLRTATKAR